MKTADNQSDFIRMPHDLLAQAQAVADEEHRTTDELVRDALQRYLESRGSQHGNERASEVSRKSLAQLLMESPFAGAELDLPPRKRLPGKKSLAQLFAESPLKGLNLTFDRDSDTGRPVTL